MLPTVFRSQSRDIPSLFSRFFNRDLWDVFDEMPVMSKLPLINVSQTDSEYKLEVLAPKLEADDLKIEIEDGVIHLSTEKEWKNDADQSLLKEYSFSYTSRSFKLPSNSDINAITAKNEDGMIVIHVPKKEEEKNKRKLIEIQ